MLTFDLYNFISNSILGGFIILIILLLKKSLFKRFSNKFNYFVWIPLLMCIIFPIKISISEASIEKSPKYLKAFYFNLPANSFNEKYNFFFNDALLYIYLGISILLMINVVVCTTSPLISSNPWAPICAILTISLVNNRSLKFW